MADYDFTTFFATITDGANRLKLASDALGAALKGDQTEAVKAAAQEIAKIADALSTALNPPEPTEPPTPALY